MSSAYILNFNTGEYSDRDERTVCVYTDPQLAERHCALANEWLKAHGLHFVNGESIHKVTPPIPPVADYEDRQNIACPYDPDLDHVDHTGGQYIVAEVVFGCEDALNRMRAYADGVRDPGFGDWCEEYSWTEDAKKFREGVVG